MAETEYGVELPNGDIHWGVALTRPIGTPEERKIFLDIVRNTAREIGHVEESFVNGYKWRTRQIEVALTKHDLTDPSALPVAEPESEPNV